MHGGEQLPDQNYRFYDFRILLRNCWFALCLHEQLCKRFIIYVSTVCFIFGNAHARRVSNPAGPIIGTALLMLLPEWFRFLQEYILLIYGLGVMVLMVVMPDGLIGGGKKAYEFIRNKRGWTDAIPKQPG